MENRDIKTETNFIEDVHYSIELENAVIGQVLLCPDLITDLITIISDKNIFYSYDNMLLYSIIGEMLADNYPVDIITLQIHCVKKTGKRIANNGNTWSYEITKRTRDVVSIAHFVHHCLKLIEFYVNRQMFEFKMQSDNYENPMKAYEELSNRIAKVTDIRKRSDWNNSTVLMESLKLRREKIRSGMSFGVNTGFCKLDEITGGLQAGFHIIAARPSMGKTAFAISMIKNIIERKYTVGLISLEMPDTQLAGRYLSTITGIGFKSIFNDRHENESERKDVDNAIDRFIGEKSTLYYTDSSTITPYEVYAKIRKLVHNNSANIIFIDYLQLIDIRVAGNQKRYEAVGELSKGLKRLSTELNIPIVALAQLNRESETADKVSKMGKASQLREAGNIEQDADIIMIIDRPYKRGQLTDENGMSTINNATISVQKHRNGEDMDIPIHFEPKNMLFKDYEQTINNQSFEFESFEDFSIKKSFDMPPIINREF